MVKVFISNNVDRTDIIVTPETTLDEVIAQCGLEMGAARPYLNGEPVYGQTNKPLKDFNVGETAYLTAVVNKDNN